MNLLKMILPLSISMLWSCGEDRKPLVQKKASNFSGAGFDLACTAKSCEKASLTVETSTGGTSLVGNVGQSVTWTVTAKTQVSSEREVVLLLTGGPSACIWRNQGTTVVSCTFTPEDPGDTGSIKAAARDVTYCKNKNKNNPSCGDMTKSTADDQDSTLSYSLENNGPSQIDPAFTQNAGLKTGANSGLRGCMIGMLPAATGFFTGNFMAPMLGCATGMVMGGGQQQQGFGQQQQQQQQQGFGQQQQQQR
jgi:hypothetical protein